MADRHPVKRCLLVLAVFVALGAVVNCAVAVACGLWATVDTEGKNCPEWARDILSWHFHNADHLPGRCGFGLTWYRVYIQFHIGDIRESAAVFAGWPMESFWGYSKALWPGERRRGLLAAEKGRWIPYLPIWSGILVNTALYTTLLMLFWFGPRGLCRWWRHRHGRCRPCGYILVDTGAACPECGRHQQ